MYCVILNLRCKLAMQKI